MDNAVFKTHFQSNPYGSKKRNKGRNKLSFREKLSLQIAACLFILMFAGIIKNADTSVTNTMSERISLALSKDANVEELTAPFANFLRAYLGDNSISSREADVINPNPSAPAKASEANVTPNEPVKATGASIDAKETINSATTPSGSSTAVLHKGIFITPTVGVLGNSYGETIDQLTQKAKAHKAVDIEAPNGTDIKAAAQGIVLEAAFEKTLGYYVKIEHDNGLNTIYGQCSQLIAKKGQSVNQGDIIGKVGSTGASIGSHLHFEVWKDGKAVNPLEYISVPAK